jgi:hypothetical protein
MFEIHESCDVAAWSWETIDKARSDWISVTSTNTIGTVRVAGCNAATIGAPAARMTSGAMVTVSAACFRISSALPAA